MFHCETKNKNIEVVKFLVERGANVNVRDEKRLTPLHKAFNFCNIEVAKFLVEKGADIEAKNCIGRTSFMLASYGGNMGNIKCLIEADVDVEVKDDDGRTFRHFLEKGKEEIVDSLLRDIEELVSFAFNDGIVYQMEQGSSFDGDNIRARPGGD